MANEVKLTIRVGDDGTLNVVAKNAKKAEGAIEGVGNATRRTTNARDKYSKTEKGVAGATANSTKAFSKMTTGISGGLVPAYATLAANVFAVTAAFGVLSRAAAVTQLREGLEFTGRAAGQNLPLVVESIKEITGAAVSSADAMRTVAVGISAGFSQSQLEGLTRVARGASLALGRDMTDAMDRLTRGAAKLEPEILDELGIMVRLDDATQTFAASMGKTASELTQFERRMAFTNAIIEQGTTKFAALSAVVDPNPYDKLAAAFDNLSKTLLSTLNTAFAPIANFLADNLGALIGVFGIFATSVVRQAVPALTQAGEASAELAAELADSSKEAIGQAKSFQGAPKVFDKYADAVSKGTASTADMKKATSSLTRSIDLHKSQMPAFVKAHGEGSKAVQDKRNKLKNAEAALLSITTAQQLETQATLQATKADALNAAASGNLRQAILLTKSAIMQEWAATMLSVKGKGLLSSALGILSGSFRIAAFSAKVFGVALLASIPIIGQIILIGSMAISFLKDFFSTPPTALEEALEENKKRFEEFPAVIEQMNVAIAAASTESEEFLAALGPTTGILNQIVEASQNLLNVQKQEQIQALVKSRLALINANQDVAKSTEDLAQTTESAQKLMNPDTSKMGFFEKMLTYASMGDRTNAAIAMQASATRKLTKATEDQAEAQESVNKATEKLGTIDPLKTIEGVTEALVTGIATFQVQKIAVADNADAVTLLNQKINGLEGILKDLADETLSPEGAVAAMQKLAAEQQAVKSSADAAKENVQAITELFATAARPSGILADHIEKLGNALKDMEAGKDFKAIRELYGDIFKKYDVDNIKSLEYILELMKQVNEEAKLRALNDEISNQRSIAYNSIGAKTFALENDIANSKQKQLELENRYAALISAGKRDEALQANLALEKEITAEQKKQLKLLTERVSAAERLGGSIMGGGAAFGAGATAADMLGLDSASEALIALNAASQKTLENLKELGPEGAVYAAILGGALNTAETWSTALEIIGDKSKDVEDRMAAGFQAVGATINAIGQMQQANADAAVAGIDRQIKAEQRRDGKSKESLARIAALEKKKDQIKRKAFEQDKKMKMAEVVMATGVAIMNSIKMGLPFGAVFGAMAAAMGAAQLAAISASQYDGGAGSVSSGGGAVAVGQRRSTVDLARSAGGGGEIAYFRGQRGMGGPEDFRPAFMGYRNRAEGGNTGFMVGEQGPEMFVPETPGRIIPADDIAAPTPVNANINISAIDAAGVEDVLINQRGNIISMIREAANAQGNTFLEEVNVAEL